MPPTKLIVLVFDAIAAATPTRYEPSSSLNSTELTFLPWALPSMMTKWTFGYSAAIFCTGCVCEKPIETISCSFLRASARSTCSACVS